MHALTAIWADFDAFLERGGPVLIVILWVAVGLWCLIAERLLYLQLTYPRQRRAWLAYWQNRIDKSSVPAQSVRAALLSEARLAMTQTLPLIRVLISLCPLLGLLGTVTGMIHVFDVLAVTGTGNARAMASGISQATLPTMAGMVIAIAGLYCQQLLEDRVSTEHRRLADLLQFQ